MILVILQVGHGQLLLWLPFDLTFISQCYHTFDL